MINSKIKVKKSRIKKTKPNILNARVKNPKTSKSKSKKSRINRKLKKDIIKAIDQCEQLNRMFSEKFASESIDLILEVILDLTLNILVEGDWQDWADQVGRATSKEGGFIVDNVFTSLYINRNLTLAKKYIKEGNELLDG